MKKTKVSFSERDMKISFSEKDMKIENFVFGKPLNDRDQRQTVDADSTWYGVQEKRSQALDSYCYCHV